METQQNEQALVTQDDGAVVNGIVQTMWNNDKMSAKAWKAAQLLSRSDLVPTQNFKGKPENCLIALDAANRMNLSPIFVMQNMYIVQGKPAWSGQFVAALVGGSGKYSDLDFTYVGEEGSDDWGCYASARRLSDGRLIKGTTVTIGMAKKEGWYQKSGSKWQTMPELMMQYRAAAFFARVNCPNVLMGGYTMDELADIGKAEPQERQTVKIVMEDVE